MTVSLLLDILLNDPRLNSIFTTTRHWTMTESFMKGYNTCMVNANEHSNAPHHAGPLPLKFMRLPQMAVQEGVQQTDNSCGGNRHKTLRLATDSSASNSTADQAL